MNSPIKNSNTEQALFVAMTDELLYETPDKIEGPLVPYSIDMECHHWLTIEINPEDVEPLPHEVAKQTGSIVVLKITISHSWRNNLFPAKLPQSPLLGGQH